MKVMNERTLCEPLQQLQEEHRKLLERIEKIYSLVRELEQASFEHDWNANYYQLYKMAVLFSGQLKFHAYQEEQFLYPSLKPYLQDESSCLMVMDYEHKQADQSLKQFIETFENRRKPLSKIEVLSLLSCLEIAYLTIVDHIHKEEVIIFPLAEQHLSLDDKNVIYEKMKEFAY